MGDQETVIKQAFEQPQWYLTKTAYNIRVRIETIKELLNARKVENILDIGCGDGSLSLHLLSATNQITLLDRSMTMLEIARSRVPEASQNRVRITNDDFMAAALPKQTFDLIICVGVLAYVTDRRRFINKIASLLKPQGTLILECTDGTHFVTLAVRAYGAVRRPLVGDKFRTIYRPSAETLAICKDAGFEVCGGFRYSLPLPGFRRFLSQEFSQRAIRLLYGNSTRNRAPWLGNECIYHFKHVGSAAKRGRTA